MHKNNRGEKTRTLFRWILWFFLIQFIFMNITGLLYGYKLTHFYEPSLGPVRPTSKNIFVKTWKLFRGPKYQKTTIAEVPHFPYETVNLTTRGKLLIEAWYIPVDSSKGTIVMFHGQGLNKSFLLQQAYEFRFLGFSIMLVDLRAHGNSGGNTTTFGVRESEEVKLAYDFLENKNERNIVFYGMSLGAVVVTKAIYDYGLKPSKIIIDMPFASLRTHLQGRARVLGFPEEPFATLVTFWSGILRGFNGFKHNTANYVRQIHCPVLMQYGALDKLVTRSETNVIYENIASPNKRLVIYENADHEFFLRKDLLKWRREVSTFLVH